MLIHLPKLKNNWLWIKFTKESHYLPGLFSSFFFLWIKILPYGFSFFNLMTEIFVSQISWEILVFLIKISVLLTFNIIRAILVLLWFVEPVKMDLTTFLWLKVWVWFHSEYKYFFRLFIRNNKKSIYRSSSKKQ